MKKSKLELDNWLESIYHECIQQKIPHSHRTFIVRSRIADFIRVWSVYPSKDEEYAVQWMEERCKKNVNLTKPMALLSFFYDTEFWKIYIPVAYGQVKLSPLDSLTDMPDYLKAILKKNTDDYNNYVMTWANAMDLTYGLQELESQNDNCKKQEFAVGLLLSGIQNLNAVTASLLFTENKDNQIVMTLRISLELFIKSYLAFNNGLDNKQAKKIGHNLKEGLSEIKKISPHLILDQYFDILDFLPEINKRYEPQDNNLNFIPICYQLTLYISAMITRSITNRNILQLPI